MYFKLTELRLHSMVWRAAGSVLLLFITSHGVVSDYISTRQDWARWRSVESGRIRGPNSFPKGPAPQKSPSQAAQISSGLYALTGVSLVSAALVSLCPLA